jgi:hypothetical protein
MVRLSDNFSEFVSKFWQLISIKAEIFVNEGSVEHHRVNLFY